MKRNLMIVGMSLAIIAALAVGWYYMRSTESLAKDYKSATYRIEGKKITLVRGFAETPIEPGSASKIITRFFGNEAVGDLDGNGRSDVAFIVTQEKGGSGQFFYAVVALNTTEGFRGTNAVLLGDRILPQPTEIRGTEAVMNYADRRSNEPMSAEPSVAVSKRLKISFGRLVEAQ